MTNDALLAVTGYRWLPIFLYYRLQRARDSAYTAKTGNQVVTGNLPPSPQVRILRHCRCLDCRKLYKAEGECFCRESIGGTATVLGTGERICDPPPEAWHYCAGYDGPPISRDVWAWPNAGAKERPAPGGGGPGSGPQQEAGRGRTSLMHSPYTGYAVHSSGSYPAPTRRYGSGNGTAGDLFRSTAHTQGTCTEAMP